jgi:zinc transporter, ZIP family
MTRLATFADGLTASFLAGLGTVVGGLWVLVAPKPSARARDVMLSAAAGVMLAATFFSLLQPGLEFARAEIANRVLAVAIVIIGLLLGAIALHVTNRYLPHEHLVKGAEGPDAGKLKRIWLFVIAITLHNFPEGMAVGVGFAGAERATAVSLAIGIGLQNIPEGLAVAASLMAIGYARSQAFWVASLTGLVEPIGGGLGSAAVWLAAPLMPVTLGFAAGAMLFVISDEIIPETHRSGHEDIATFSLIGGFAVMMFLDTALSG